jgi:hypothetical protein
MRAFFRVSLIALLLVGICGCNKEKPIDETAKPTPTVESLPPTVETAAPAQSVATAAPAPTASEAPPEPQGPPPGMAGTLKANPSPVPLCEKTKLGVTTVSWTFSGTTAIEVHVDKPDGPLLASAKGNGKAKTGNWVTNGTTFYLQNTANDAPKNAANTLAKLTVDTTTGPCPH